MKRFIGPAVFLLMIAGTALGSNFTVTADVTADTATLVCSDVDGKLLCKPIEKSDIEFTTSNLVVLRGPIVAASASNFVRDFNVLENKDEVQTIYVYVRSPGGSIFAGDYITNVIQSSKKKVVMVIDFAASMAFHIIAHADKRVMVPTGTMMQHHASGGTGDGEFPNVDSQWNWIKRKVELMNQTTSVVCKNVTFDQYKKNIDRDWWLLSNEALEAGCIDTIATNVSCSQDLSKQEVKEVFSFYGMEIGVTWSGCPLEAYPKEIKIGGSYGSGGYYGSKILNAEEQKIVDDFISLLTDPLQYYNLKGSFDLDKYFRINKKEASPIAK